MQAKYPFFEFVWKDPRDEGQARSMSILRQLVRSPFLLYLDDDWEFFAPRPYVEPAMEILNGSTDIGQVLFSRNYAESLEDREVPGGHVARSWKHGYRFRVHEHYEVDSPDYRRFQEAHANRPTSAYWPHFSLRPSLIKTGVLANVGEFDEDATHFELDYARRYVQRGFRSAFFDGVYCLHSGRLTSSRPESQASKARAVDEASQRAGACGMTDWRRTSVPPMTFVTGFLDLSRYESRPAGKSWEDYLEHAAWLLQKPLPLVVFADSGRLEALRRLRPTQLPTYWVPFDRDDLAAWPQYERIRACIDAEGYPAYTWVDKDTPLYLMVGWQKTEWLRHAARVNPFSSSHFAWIDMGIHWAASQLGARALDEAIDRVVAAPPPQRLRFCSISYVAPEAAASRDRYFARHRWPVAGGFFAGSGEKLEWFANQLKRQWQTSIEQGLVTNDEMMFGYLVQRYPERFELYYGDHASVVANYAEARCGHDAVLRAVEQSRHAGDHRDAIRRLESIRPYVEDDVRRRAFRRQWELTRFLEWSSSAQEAAATSPSAT